MEIYEHVPVDAFGMYFSDNSKWYKCSEIGKLNLDSIIITKETKLQNFIENNIENLEISKLEDNRRTGSESTFWTQNN